ncbi:MAG: MFS transporter [Gammaproteobacteria bacterium]|nr:MFS transporter [Gammaproteobacteria bacterium]
MSATIAQATPPPKLSRWQLALLFSALMISALGQTLIYAILPPVGRELGLSELQVGMVITFSALAAFVFALVWGRLSDRWGRVWVIVAGLAGYGLFTLAFVATIEAGMAGVMSVPATYALMLASRMAFGAVASAVGPAAQAYVVDVTTASERTAGLAVMNAAYGVGMVLGPVMAGVLVFLGLLAPLYIAAGMALVCAVAVRVHLREPARHLPATDTPEFRMLATIWPYMLIASMLAISLSISQQVAPFYLQDMLALGVRDTVAKTGAALVCLALAAIFVQTALVSRYRWPPRLLLRAGLPLIAAGNLLILAVDDLPLFLVSFAVLGAGFGLAIPGYSAAASLLVPADKQGRMAGLLAAGLLGGFVIGPVSGAALYQLQASLPYLLNGVLGVALAVLTLTLRIPAPRDAIARPLGGNPLG